MVVRITLFKLAVLVGVTEVGVLTDSSGDYYVTSYDSQIHVYDRTGTYQESYTLPVGGSRAAPYIVNFFMKQKS